MQKMWKNSYLFVRLLLFFDIIFCAFLDIFHSAAQVYVCPHRRYACSNLRRRRAPIFWFQRSWWNIVCLLMSSVSQTDDNLRAPSLVSVADEYRSHFCFAQRETWSPHMAYNRIHLLQAINSIFQTLPTPYYVPLGRKIFTVLPH